MGATRFLRSKFVENIVQATARDILCYAMQTLRCCSIVMHIHDEVVIEADPRMSLDVVCEQMGRTPPWAKGLLLRADGYATPFIKRLDFFGQTANSSPFNSGDRKFHFCFSLKWDVHLQ